MKVLLVTDYFYPQSSGGTEKYVHELAQGLKEIGTKATILTIAQSVGNYDYDGFTVHAIPANTDSRKEVIAGLTPADNLQFFIDKINDIKPEVIHFHTFTTSIGIFHYKAAKQTGAKIIFTSHIPGNTCLRGDLMRYGTEICDGKVRLNTCQACYLNHRGMPKAISPVVAKAMRLLKQPAVLSQASTIKKQQLEELKTTCDTIVTMSNWQQDVFLINDFSNSQLALSRHIFKPFADYNKPDKNPIVIGFAGRVSPEKGLDRLIGAFKQLDPKRFNLSIAGIKSVEHQQYLDNLLQQTQNYPNIKWGFNYTADNIDSFYKELTVLCIPSIWHETGPYVMFEAIARHIPVIASNLGGMREWAGLNYPVITYPFDDVSALTSLLNALPGSINKKFDYPLQRTQTDLAKEMLALYTK